ncbi:acid protease [Penicillium angulare]|uniref:penicillopepsin n=1 Tax=Penicillium angulare TaxID=116970 RepID=A0A9W9FUY7_9EURO|nr:acid protease [Penicillium angulare]
MFIKSTVIGTLAFISTCAAVPRYKPSRIDLEHRPGSNIKSKYDVDTLTEASRFWFGNFDVGDSKNLSLLIDTGSSDLIVNPGFYRPGPGSVNTHKNFTISYGSTESDGSGTGTVTGQLYNDTVRFGAMTAHQTVGTANAGPDGTSLVPKQGIIGFAGLEESSFHGALPFFHSLCAQGKVDACRFGISLGDNGKGTQVLGQLDESMFKGELTTSSIIQEWALWTDIALDNKIILKNALVELDTGTATILGPVDDVVKIFKAASIQYNIQESESAGTTVTGYFPCDQPPQLGLSIPSRSNATEAAKKHSRLVSHKSSVFNIKPDQWIAKDNGNNNCTAIVSGTDAMPLSNLWVVGQPFFHGIYVDHNIADGTLGFAPVRA